MKQSSVIFGVLLLAFFIYITMRGQLPDYIDLFRKSDGQKSSGTNSMSDAAKKAFGGGLSGVIGGLPSIVQDYIGQVLKNSEIT